MREFNKKEHGHKHNDVDIMDKMIRENHMMENGQMMMTREEMLNFMEKQHRYPNG